MRILSCNCHKIMLLSQLILLFSSIFLAVWFVDFGPWDVHYDEEDMEKKLQCKISEEDKKRAYEAQFLCID